MKKHLTDSLAVTIESKRKKRTFIVPREKAKGLVCLIEEFEVEDSKDKLAISDDVFGGINQKYTKPGAMLKGARLKEELTQKELANKLGIPQNHISAMEHGKRTIGKNMARRLAKVLGISYKVFL
jgi:DNA-binding XRE family transcriptional regulator